MLVTNPAPDFTATTVLGNGSIVEDFKLSENFGEKGTVRHAVINDLPLGRNIDEMLRMVDTMHFTDEHGEVCPAGWVKGDEGMKATTEGVAEYLGKNEAKL